MGLRKLFFVAASAAAAAHDRLTFQVFKKVTVES